MARGRCAGCGREGSASQVSAHILDCPDWAVLYRSDPSAALAPEAAYAAWRSGGQQAARTAQRARVATEHTERRTAQSSRFARLPDPLED